METPLPYLTFCSRCGVVGWAEGKERAREIRIFHLNSHLTRLHLGPAKVRICEVKVIEEAL